LIIPAGIRAIKATLNEANHPRQNVNKAVLKNISTTSCNTAQQIILIIYAGLEKSLPRKNNPKMKPDKNSMAVICGINGPTGAKRQFSISPDAPQIPPHNGPYINAVTKTEINLRGILTRVPILNVQKIESKAVTAISRPRIHTSRI
jgi:hypothetical protein